MPGRFRRAWLTLLIVLVLAGGGYVAFRAATAGQAFDPALDTDVGAESPRTERDSSTGEA